MPAPKPARWSEYVPIEDLRGHPDNPKDHDLALLDESFDRFGFVDFLAMDERTGLVASGHGRLERLLARQAEGGEPPEGVVVKRGRWCVPVARGWSSADDDDARAYLAAANRIGEVGGWRDDVGAFLDALQSTARGLAGVGFDGVDVDDLLGRQRDPLEVLPGRGTATDPEDAIAPPAEPVTVEGDLWLLGPHRLLCGSCTMPDVVHRLMPEPADMLLTDPPYCSGGFQEAGRMGGSIGTVRTSGIIPQIANDRLSTRGYTALIREMLDASRCAIAYVFTDWRMWVNLFDVVESQGYGVRSMIVWDKGSPGMGMGWRAQHELVLMASKATIKWDKRGAAAGNVVQAQRTGNPLHPTQKPVALLEHLIATTTPVRTIFDPFAGSGSTLIAAHRTGRTCYAMELDQTFCDVILTRWQAATGERPILERTGEPVDFPSPE